MFEPLIVDILHAEAEIGASHLFTSPSGQRVLSELASLVSGLGPSQKSERSAFWLKLGQLLTHKGA